MFKTSAGRPRLPLEQINPNNYLKRGGGNEHRVAFARLLGTNLPRNLDVHHIDGNKHNNEPNNLALVTRGGHLRIHRLMKGGA
jgi:hypothetical protein